MYIKDNRKPKTKMFLQLSIGEVFYDIHDTESFCMKIDTISTKKEDINAINLQTGSTYTFNEDEEVEVVTATLNIN